MRKRTWDEKEKGFLDKIRRMMKKEELYIDIMFIYLLLYLFAILKTKKVL